MKNNNNLPDWTNGPRGLTFVDGLQLLFIGLKIAGVINWNWVCVFLPFIIYFLVTLGAVITLAIFLSKNNDK
jgi:hypothetical protein